MQKKTIALIISYSIPVITLFLALANNWYLTSICIVTILVMVTAYLRARGIFNNRIPGKFNTLASFVIGITMSITVFLVDIFLANHDRINHQIFDSIYIATIITGFIFTIAMFVADHTSHVPGDPQQKRGDIIFATFASVFLVAILVFSLIVDINFAL